MPRVLSTAIVLALLAATAGAFALTERAKLERSPIYGTRVDPIFSPNGKTKPVAHIRFRIRPHERIDVWVQPKGGGPKVADLLVGRNVKPHERFDLVWDGFTPAGVLVPDGVYQPVVKLIRSHRTIVLPSDIRLDTKPPTITIEHLQTKYPIISPDGDGHRDTAAFAYRVSEPAHAILLMRGKQVVFTLGQKETGRLSWNGFRPRSTTPLPPGRYALAVAAQDRAGNRSAVKVFAIAQIRYVVLARNRVVVKPGKRFFLRVSTDAPVVHWLLHGRSGTAPRGTLRVRAPKRPGVYHLFVSAAGHGARCTVVVG